ncbi:MAG: DUF1015 domain-containing protein [Thermodesulfobacteriota bacterium]
MAHIEPFRGLTYSPDKIDDMQSVMAPPYDVISGELQESLYHRHPNNIVRLILGKTYPDDTPTNNRYTRAAMDFKGWRSEGVLTLDEKPSIYYYVQSYTLNSGEKRTRKGFIARALLEEFGKGSIHPHEKTLSGPKADRLKLTEACRANFSCILSLYSQPSLKINGILEDSIEDVPFIDIIDDEGATHIVWRIDDPAVIESIAKDIADMSLFIADGHHRYETALNYRNLVRERSDNWSGTEPENYVMMYFSNMDDEGMTVLPIHRIVHTLPDFNPERFLNDCSAFFEIDGIEFDETVEPRARRDLLEKLSGSGRKYSFGLSMNGINTYYILTLKERGIIDREMGESVPSVFRELDVSVLHALILDRILGIDAKAQEAQTNIIYKKDPDAAFQLVRDGAQMALFLNATKIGQVNSVSEAGLTMPQKSTYFYPKLLSGLVINPFR